jgi:hypothetical protein
MNTTMKKMMIALLAMLTMSISASAMSYEQARDQALFLTDKMAYELNLTEDQYEAAYEINLDYLLSIDNYDDLYGTYWERRNLDLSYVLLDWQYRSYLAATYFYRPLYWDAGYWHFGIYARYPHRTWFYFGRPAFYYSYHGGHAWHRNGGRSWYHGRTFGRDHRVARGSQGHGMRNGYDQGRYNDRRGNFERRQGGRGLERVNGNSRMQSGPAHRSGSFGGARGSQAERQHGTHGDRQVRPDSRQRSGSQMGTRSGSDTYQRSGSRGSFGNRPSSTRQSVGSGRTERQIQSSPRSGSSMNRGSGSYQAPTRTFTPSQRSSGSSSMSVPSHRSSSSFGGSSRSSAPSRSGSSFGGGSRSSGGSSFGGGSRGGGSHGGGSHGGGGHFGGRR